MVKTPKAFREFFLDDRQDLQAELRVAVETAFEDWLESPECQALREQTRQRWLKAGINIAEHTDPIGQLRLLVAKASPELLPATFRDGSWFWDSPPREWFASLFEAACQAQTNLEAAGTTLEHLEHHKLIPGLRLPINAEFAEVWNTIQESKTKKVNVAEICRNIAKRQGGTESQITSRAESIRVQFNRWRGKT